MENSTKTMLKSDELELLTFNKKCCDNKSIADILNGNLKEHLTTHLSKEIIDLFINNNIEAMSKILDGKNEIEQFDIFLIGVTSFLSFIKENWCGPFDNIYESIDKINMDDKIATEKLFIDSLEVLNTINHPKLLLLAKFIFSNTFQKVSTSKWWLMRCIYIHQAILEESSGSLFDQIQSVTQHLKDTIFNNNQNSELKSMFHMELFHIYLHYGMITKCQQEIDVINDTSDMTMELTGAMGKRTRWQQKELAQLLLNINIRKNDNKMNDETVEQSKDSQNTKQQTPVIIKLDDEDRLDTIQYNETIDIPALTSLQQIIIYINLLFKFKITPLDKLKHEELRPYVDILLQQNKGKNTVWGVQYGCLFIRSKLEADQRRTVERSMVQLEELNASLNKIEPNFKERFNYFFQICSPNINQLQSYLANVLISLGDIKSAVNIYERLHQWEDLIMCYNLLQLRHLSVDVINEQLKKGETPKLYCLLGDATDDIQHYHKAWELSEHKSSRSMKCLGMYYFKRKNFSQAIEYFEKSLSINSIQIDLWSRLGFAALEEQKWNLCCSAYNRYVTFEPEDFHGWNNMAKAYIERGEKVRAYHALSEAVKVSNMDNWKVIDNLMRISIDVGDFESAVRNYNYILDIKTKHLDIQVLEIIVKAINENLNDINNRQSRFLLKNGLKLFGRLTSEILNEYELWFLYAKLTQCNERSEINNRKIYNYIQHAYNNYMNNFQKIIIENSNFEKLLNIVKFMFDIIMKLCHPSDNVVVADKKQLLYGLKINLNNVKVQLEKYKIDNKTDDNDIIVDEMKNMLKNVEDMMKTGS